MKKLTVTELAEKIRYYSNLYYNYPDDDNIIPDSEFDQLIDQMKILDPNNSVLVETGSRVSFGHEVKHKRMMGSLNKEKTIESLDAWWSQFGTPRPELIVMPKMDGCSAELVYSNGNLIRASTRGNGEIGQDVTDNIKASKTIPSSIGTFDGELYVEIVMHISDFNKLNEEGYNLANPRNSATGSIRRENPEETALRPVHAYVYDYVTNRSFETEQEKKAWFIDNYHNIPYVLTATVTTIDEAKRVIDIIENKRRHQLDYCIDGLVFAISNIKLQQSLGWSGNCPKGKMAFKFKPQRATTKLNDIIWQVGRSGKLTPVACVDSVKLDGSTVVKASLHNISIIRSLDVVIGDTITIEKAGDIIPYVVNVASRERLPGIDIKSKRKYPINCPVCNQPTEEDARNVSIWCTNPLCPAKRAEQIYHYLKVLDVKGIGPSTIQSLISSGLVQTVTDLYLLDESKIIDLTGGERSAQIVIQAINSKKEISLDIFLASLGIPNLGKTISKQLAKKYFTLDRVLRVTKSELVQMDGIGETIAESIVSNFELLSCMISNLLKYVNVLPVEMVDGPLSGTSYCLTGKMSRSRKLIEADIIAAGGEIKSVGKDLTYLVQADPSSASSKSKRARELGIEIISEDDLMNLIRS